MLPINDDGLPPAGLDAHCGGAHGLQRGLGSDRSGSESTGRRTRRGDRERAGRLLARVDPADRRFVAEIGFTSPSGAIAQSREDMRVGSLIELEA